MSILTEQTAAIRCPDCHREEKKTISWLQGNSSFTCPNCGELVIVDPVSLLEELNRAVSP